MLLQSNFSSYPKPKSGIAEHSAQSPKKEQNMGNAFILVRHTVLQNASGYFFREGFGEG